MSKVFTALISLCAAGFLAGCQSAPPANPDNLCSIFQEKDSWYVAAHRVHEKYGVPINVAMAIMSTESAYRGEGQPQTKWFLFIPYDRGDDSYVFASPSDEVWEQYRDEAGSFFSSKDSFADALDFVGWYMKKTKEINGILLTDAYNQFLNYREGWSGFARGTYEDKDWLVNLASEVAETSNLYREQLLKCNLY